MSFFHYQLGNNPLPGGNNILSPTKFGIEHQGKFTSLIPKSVFVPTSETYFIVGPNTNLYYSDYPTKFGMQVIENNYPQSGRYNIPTHYQNKKVIVYQGYSHNANYKDMFPGKMNPSTTLHAQKWKNLSMSPLILRKKNLQK